MTKKELAFVFILVLLLTGYLHVRTTKNLIVPHPFPKITKIIPILSEIDKRLIITANIAWCIAIEKTTGEEYLFWKDGRDHFLIMNYNKRKEYIRISKEVFFKRFFQSINQEKCFSLN